MAKKATGSRSTTSRSAKPLDAKDAKIGRINTWQDVADVEDEFHMNRDKISLEEDILTKRRNESNDAFDDPSDEEVLELEDLPSSDEDDYNTNANDTQFSEDEDEVESEDQDAGGWGTSKRDYYDADEIENEEDAAEEEAEARRLQAKQLASLSASDFVFDEGDWKDPDEMDDIQEGVDDMPLARLGASATVEERRKLLDLLHPEFKYLMNEFLDLDPLLEPLSWKLSAIGSTEDSTVRTKHTVLSTYLGVLSMYFALLTRDRPTGEMSNLKEHKVMDSLLKCRQMWLKVVDLEEEVTPLEGPTLSITSNGITDLTNGITSSTKKVRTPEERAARAERKRKRESDPATLLADERKAQRLAKTEAELADLDSLLQTSIAKKSLTKGKVAPTDTDFGEETHLFEDDADEKAKRKKSLRFYTSQIAQKSGKRGRAGRDAGGDLDVPHKEREKERKERLLADAIKKGQSGLSAPSADLDDEDFDEDDTLARNEVNEVNEDEEYYNTIAAQTTAAKATKKLIYDAEKAGERVIETEIIDPTTGKRAIGYTIEKNKGLTPHRKKDVRNPRVKKRKKYEAAKKKLGSKKAIYKVPTTAYGGESTGIKTRLVKSVKFK